jgi:rubrerythrin
MNPSFARRIQKLEERFPAVQPAPPSAEDLLFWERLEQLLAQRDAKYLDSIREDLQRPLSQASQLTLAVCQRVLDHIRQNTPLAFPREVAEVYLHRKVTGETVCSGCGYSVPAASFKACPVCGGRLY